MSSKCIIIPQHKCWQLHRCGAVCLLRNIVEHRPTHVLSGTVKHKLLVNLLFLIITMSFINLHVLSGANI